MDQQQKIPICFKDGQEASFTNEYTAIMTELSQRDNTKWYVYDCETGIEINITNLEFFSKLIAMRDKDIAQVFSNLLEWERLKQENFQLKNEYYQYKTKADDFDKLKQYYPIQAIQEGTLQLKLKEQEMEITQLKNQLQECQIQLQEQEGRKETTINDNQQKLIKLVEQKKEIQILQVQSLEQSNKLVQYEQQMSSLSDRNLYQQNILEQLSEEKKQLIKDYNQQSKKVEEFSQEIQKLKDDKYQSTQKIVNLEIKLSTLQGESQTRQIQGSQQQLAPQTDIQQDINNLYADQKISELIEKNNSNSNQIKFLDHFVEKKCDDNKEERQKFILIDETQAINIKNWLGIFQVTLKKESFRQTIQEKNFFFRNSYFKKNIVFDKEHIYNKGQIQILINGQPLNIERVYKMCKFEYEALDIILNLLLVEGYIKLFEEDLQQTKMASEQFEKLNLKFPRQFLIKDEIGNYYIYQECFGNNQANVFIPFENSQNVDQYISSFFKYFYFSTNKNFAITECQLKAQKNNQQNKEIIISNIVIHSKYKEGFSQLDEGMEKINLFEFNQSQAPPGTIQKYWSDKLLKYAQQNWNDQQNN